MKNQITLLILLSFISIGIFYFFKSASSSKPVEVTALSQNPQEYMRNASVKIFAKEGFLKEEILAHDWSYRAAAGQSTLTMPKAIIYKPNGSRWILSAKAGVLKQPTLGTIEKIELQGNVSLERPATSTLSRIQMKTQKLDYYPKRQLAENTEAVTLTKPGLTILGTGVRISFDEASIALLQDVKTYYQLP